MTLLHALSKSAFDNFLNKGCPGFVSNFGFKSVFFFKCLTTHILCHCVSLYSDECRLQLSNRRNMSLLPHNAPYITKFI